jgi:hypothetical protein
MNSHVIRNAALSILALTLCAAGQARSNPGSIMEFAELTRQAILDHDIEFLRTHMASEEPFEGADFTPWVDDWVYAGGPNRRSVNEILSHPDLRIEILENWIQPDHQSEAVHLIIYYSGELEEIDWEADYMQRFCVTEVRQHDGRWRFAYSLFRSESGHPFAGDYG